MEKSLATITIVQDVIKYKEIFKNVVERHNKIEFALKYHPGLRDRYNAIKNAITFSVATSFKVQRQNELFEQSTTAMKKQRRPNKTELQRGVGFTPAVSNKKRFHYVKKEEAEGLKLELQARGVTDFSTLDTFGKLKKKLKELVFEEEGGEDIKDIKFFPILSNYEFSKDK